MIAESALLRSVHRAVSFVLTRLGIAQARSVSAATTFHPLWPHLVGVIAIVMFAAVLLIWPAQSLESNLTRLTFFPAVIVATIYGGIYAGLLAIGLSCLAMICLLPWPFIEPLVIGKSPEWGEITVLLLMGGVMSGATLAFRPQRAGDVEAHNTLVKAMDEGFCIVEMIYDSNAKPVDYRFLEINPAFEKQTGLHQAQGKTIREMVPNHDVHWFEIYGKVARTGTEIRFENSAVAMEKHYDVFAFRIELNKVGVLFKDISDRKKIETELFNHARHDKLTGLANRMLFNEYFTKAIARAERGDHQLALLFLDLDGFKVINDSCGHHAGDILLRLVAQRLLSCVRSGDLISRFGGDEFTIIVEDCDQSHLIDIAEKIIQILGDPFDLDGQAVKISTSIGIAIYPDCAADQETLIKMADTAMYAAKKDGKNRYKFSD
jgi:diguanylate cyclase (GGDEF)-like protein